MSGSRAAARGGFTSVLCMANTSPIADNAAVIKDIRKEARIVLYIFIRRQLFPRALRARNRQIWKQLKEMGVPCFTDDGLPLMNAGLVRGKWYRQRHWIVS